MGSTVVKKGNRLTSTVNADSKKTKAELDAIGKKLTSNKKETDDSAASNAFNSMNSEFAGKKKEIKDFKKMNKTDFSKMTTEQLLELQRRQRDLGSTSATKNFKKGGIVRSAGLARRKR